MTTSREKILNRFYPGIRVSVQIYEFNVFKVIGLAFVEIGLKVIIRFITFTL